MLDAVEPFRSDADNGDGRAVHDELAADDARVCPKPLLPHAKADDRHWMRAGRPILLWREPATSLHSNAERA